MGHFTVEKDWITGAGMRAVVIMGSMGFRCGYVGVQPGHPLYGIGYSQETDALFPLPEDEKLGKRSIVAAWCAASSGRIPQTPEMAFDVHGGLTYSGGEPNYPVKSDLWWFGFDCGHAGDASSPEYMQAMREKYPESVGLWRQHGGEVHRSLEYAADECESLAQQIIDKTVTPA